VQEPAEPSAEKFPAVGLVRAVRRHADLSQRELAQRASVCRSTVSKIEAGEREPSLALFERLVRAAGCRLVVVNEHNHVLQPMVEAEDLRDSLGRRFPSHLDLIIAPRRGEWWADQYGLARPPETFHRDRVWRDRQRRRSRWEVRVKQLRNAPAPPFRPEFYREVR
jgi:transcriptional regulator with XRE-family HTH domain